MEAVSRGSRARSRQAVASAAAAAAAAASATEGEAGAGRAESLVARSQTRGSGPWRDVSRNRKQGRWGCTGSPAVEGVTTHVTRSLANVLRGQRAARGDGEWGWEGVSDAAEEDDFRRTKVPLRRAKSVLSLTPKKRRQRVKAHLGDRLAPEGLGFLRIRQTAVGGDTTSHVPGSLASLRVLRSVVGPGPGQARPSKRRRPASAEALFPSGEGDMDASSSSSSEERDGWRPRRDGDEDVGSDEEEGEGDSTDSALRALAQDLMGLSDDDEDEDSSEEGNAQHAKRPNVRDVGHGAEDDDEDDDDWL